MIGPFSAVAAKVALNHYNKSKECKVFIKAKKLYIIFNNLYSWHNA